MVSGLVKMIESLLNRMEQFLKPHVEVQAEEREFQTSVPCANLMKMKTHSQFILINWNIMSPKIMVRNNIFER